MCTVTLPLSACSCVVSTYTYALYTSYIASYPGLLTPVVVTCVKTSGSKRVQAVMRRHASFCSVHTDSVVLNITFWLSTRMQKVMCRDGSKISATISQDVSLTSVGGQIGQKKLIASCSFLFAVFKLEE